MEPAPPSAVKRLRLLAFSLGSVRYGGAGREPSEREKRAYHRVAGFGRHKASRRGRVRVSDSLRRIDSTSQSSARRRFRLESGSLYGTRLTKLEVHKVRSVQHDRRSAGWHGKVLLLRGDGQHSTESRLSGGVFVPSARTADVVRGTLVIGIPPAQTCPRSRSRAPII